MPNKQNAAPIEGSPKKVRKNTDMPAEFRKDILAALREWRKGKTKPYQFG